MMFDMYVLLMVTISFCKLQRHKVEREGKREDIRKSNF